jgi:uncharacterized membrane protein YhaH (DUF805 family)
LSFVDAIKSGFQNYVNFKGRASRSAYWWWVLFFFIATAVGTAILGEDLGSIVQLALLLPTLAAAVRRMHDIGRSGWWILLPIVNFIFALMPTVQEVNKWGPPAPPKS